MHLEPPQVVLSACKPADREPGALLVRLLNPSDELIAATLRFTLPFADVASVRLDETPADEPFTRDGAAIHLPLPAHTLRSLLIR